MFFIVSYTTTFSKQVSLPYLVPLQSLETYKVKITSLVCKVLELSVLL